MILTEKVDCPNIDLLILRLVKYVLTIAMIGVLILPSLTKVGIVLNYLVHREYIVQNYCINIDEPMVMCNASCYLSDQLQAVDHRNQDQAPLTKSLLQDINAPYKASKTSEKESLLAHLSKELEHAKTPLYSSDWLSNIFRPPCFNLV